MTVVRDPRTKIFSLGASGGVRLLAPPLDSLLGLNHLGRHYARLPQGAAPREFIETLFENLDVRLRIAPGDLERIPAQGPVIVVANHPYGGIEGLALALLLLTVRPDVKVMANRMLGRIPELRDLFVFVDPFERPDSPRRSLAGLREASRWLKGGGVLAVFPAGEVAHLHLRQRAIIDPPWLPTVARLVRRAACPVVPVWFCGHNGPLFQLAGMVHPLLRTVMLPRELLARRGSPLEARVGSPVTSSRLATCVKDEDLLSLLRALTEILAERPDGAKGPVQPRRTPAAAVPLVAAVTPETLEAEIASLGDEAVLTANGAQRVYVADAHRIPGILHEIGRLRELTFRAVGEGTGRELDLDRFDDSYRHLFIWHSERREIVGAYRIGRTDQLLAAEGIRGLYTSTLFRFSSRLFEKMGPALEMGRSFIRPEHQRSFTGLLLLWKGIGQFVVRHPDCATLFGPVSISADYRSASQQLIASFLKQNAYRHEWARWVHARTPFRSRPSRVIRRGVADLADLDEVSQFIAEIEADGKGVPVLLKQYLKLGGRLLGFNVDPDFSNVLDVLVMVDLRQTDPRTLVRYMGADGARTFLAHRATVTD
jgi:putative hemolysin